MPRLVTDPAVNSFVEMTHNMYNGCLNKNIQLIILLHWKS